MPKCLVSPQEVLSADELRCETWILKTIVTELSTADDCLRWLARRRLIRNAVDCVTCGRPASLVAYRQGLDGRRWSCRACGFRRGVRTGSFFERSHLSLNQTIMFLYCWSQDMPQNTIARETQMSESTVVDWSNFCREVCKAWVERQQFHEIGGIKENGEPIIVEIDETKYYHRKSHTGRWRAGHWVFGAIERDSGRCFLAEIPNRNAQTLLALIEEHVLPGSHVMSDELPAYEDIGQINDGIYMHSVVEHKKHFVNPHDSDVNTQTIENLWMQAKRKLRRQCGTSEKLFPSYLHEFVFRNALRHTDIFSSFLIALSESYPV